ncbi:DNA translocase FtsK [Loigolactobacillus binensis]
MATAKETAPQPVTPVAAVKRRSRQPLPAQRTLGNRNHRFTPKYIPQSRQQRPQTDEQIYLAHLVTVLTKPAASYLLFGDATPPTVAESDPAEPTFVLASEQTITAATATVTSPAVAVSAAATSEPAMDRFEATEPTSTQSAEAVGANTAVAESVAPISAVAATSESAAPAAIRQPSSTVAPVASAESSIVAETVPPQSAAPTSQSAAAKSVATTAPDSDLPSWRQVIAAVTANTPSSVAPDSQETAAVQRPQESAPLHQAVNTVGDTHDAKAQLKLKQQAPLDDQHYQLPPFSLLPEPVKDNSSAMKAWVEQQRTVLNETLKAFNVQATVSRWSIGPAVTQFEVSLARGVKVSKITNLSDDLKLALAAKDIRIEAPIPGKSTVGIEIPNLKSRPVMLSEVVASTKFQESKSPLTVALGVDLFGQPMVTNVAKMPHGLIAGATGSGKSVFINSLLLSILFKAKPSEVKLLLIDPKAVELAPYNGLPHLLSPVISDPKAAAAALKWAVDEMENRYQKLAAAGVRNLEQFNAKASSHHDYGQKMPYIVIIIDELADLMMVASSEVQDYIVRITQKARAAGIHLLVATQRPSVDVITGTIKNNIPTRIAFMVSSQIDSRTIIDQGGAERLLGRGDMLYLGNGQSQPLRIQGTYAESEIDPIVAFVKQQLPPHYLFEPEGLLEKVEATENQDEIFPEVLDYIANEAQVSTSKLQRVFSIGYNRAANLIDSLEQRKLISPASGSKPRDVYFTPEDLAQYQEHMN